MHEEAQDKVVMMNIGVTKIDFTLEHSKIKFVRQLIEVNLRLQLQFEVFEVKLYLTFAWQKDRVQLLVSGDLPFFDSRKVEVNYWLMDFWDSEFQIDVKDI